MENLLKFLAIWVLIAIALFTYKYVLAADITDSHWLEFNSTTAVLWENVQHVGTVITTKTDCTLKKVTVDTNTDATIAYLYSYEYPFIDTLLQSGAISSYEADFDYSLTSWVSYAIVVNAWSGNNFNVWFAYNDWVSYDRPIEKTNIDYIGWYEWQRADDRLDSVLSITTDDWTSTQNTNNFFHFFN